MPRDLSALSPPPHSPPPSQPTASPRCSRPAATTAMAALCIDARHPPCLLGGPSRDACLLDSDELEGASPKWVSEQTRVSPPPKRALRWLVRRIHGLNSNRKHQDLPSGGSWDSLAELEQQQQQRLAPTLLPHPPSVVFTGGRKNHVIWRAAIGSSFHPSRILTRTPEHPEQQRPTAGRRPPPLPAPGTGEASGRNTLRILLCVLHC